MAQTVKASACNAGDPGSISASGRSPGEGNGNPLQYSCWKIPWMKEPGGLQSMGLQIRTWLSDFTFLFQQFTMVSFSPHPRQQFLSCLFGNNHPNRCKVISPCGLYLHFLEDWWHCAFFQVTLGHLCLIWKNVYSAPLVLFKLGFCFIVIVLYVVYVF